jgi:hypothetical protein
MIKSENMMKAIVKVEYDHGYQFVGKSKIHGITYYSFVDNDYLPHEFSAKYMWQLAKGLREIN